ncbi:MAG: O-antigen ligase family protein [bacterium]
MNSPFAKIRDVALLVWAFLLPLQTRYFLHPGQLNGTWEYGTLSMYATDGILLVALLCSFCTDRAWLWKRPKDLPRSVLVAALAVVASVLFSSVNALDVGVALGVSLRFVLGLAAAWLIAKSSIRMTAFAVVLAVSAAFESILMLTQFVLQTIPASTLFGIAAHAPSVAGDAVVETSIGRFLRSYGTLPHPNMAAGWLAFGLIICVVLYLRFKDPLERAVVLSGFSMITAGLFLSFSRAGLLGWLAVFLLLVFVLLLRERWEGHHRWHWWPQSDDIPLGLKTIKLVAAALFLLGAFLFVYAPLVHGRTSTDNRLEARSVSERIAQIDEARTIIGKYWLFGVGVGNETKAVHDVIDAGRSSWGYQPAHNVFLLLLTEIGGIGAILVVWCVVSVVRESFQELRRRWSHQWANGPPWLVFLSAGILLLLLLGLVDHYLWSLPFGVAFSSLVFGLWLKSFRED